MAKPFLFLLLAWIPLKTATACSGPEWTSFNDKCFRMKEEKKMTFTEAIDSCTSDGATLALIHSSDEEGFIEQNLLHSEGEHEYEAWIGGVRVGHQNNDHSFRWLNGDRFNYSSWMQSSTALISEPNNEDGVENCVAISFKQDYKLIGWIDTDCGRKLNVLCEKSVHDLDHRIKHSASLAYEIKSLYHELDDLRIEKNLYDNKKWILVAIITALTLIITIMCLVADFSELSVARFIRTKREEGRQADESPIVASNETTI